ncbi:hypothetical protein SBOR_5508 [Sclerotinia borealis F-4128]|uniref:Cytosine-specific methyltransferase n=1 Tax=Sclerotinia borealis (strain F-4128) TaxID=1432307 RepID=W9CE13_SCLBF|nr:hypothetical protein SBOR_5508 [Sclerotinia borealis F-4128]
MQHQELQCSNSEPNSMQTMPRSGSFTRAQSTSTDNFELLHQQLLAQQLVLDQTLPPEVDDRVLNPYQTSKIASIHPPQLIYPRSRYHGYIPSIPTSKEHQACAALLHEIRNKDGAGYPWTQEDFVEFGLTEFSVYIPDTPLYGFELRSLQDLASKVKHSCLLFDGILSVGSLRRYVEGVPFKICSIGNYGEKIDDVGDAIWLQSNLNTNTNIYYRLQVPAPEYARFHLGFLWLANLSKHFVDYSLECQDRKKKVSIHNFRADFAHWGWKAHTGSAKFQSWYLEYGRDDFRQAISANINFLFKESVGVTEKLRSLYIWKETLEKSGISQQPIKENMTIVTPYVYGCFSHLKFGHLLKSLVPAVCTEDTHKSEEQSLSLSPRNLRSTPDPNPPTDSQYTSVLGGKDSLRGVISQEGASKRQHMIDAIKIGDVLSVTKDGPNAIWKDETSRWKTEDHCWYLYVQIKHRGARGKYSFDGIWLYRPSDTSCAKMKYPYPKELFLSDNCTCGSHDSRIPQDEVIDIMRVVWHGLPSVTDMFIRQTYLGNDNFVTLKNSHKTGEHLRAPGGDYPSSSTIIDGFPIGQTIIALPPLRKSRNGLEPYEIVRYEEEGAKQYVTLRRLVRRLEFDRTVACRPNELIYTALTDKMPANKLERTCLVRCYTEKEVLCGNIPAPYCRDGSSNAFIITKRLREDDQKLIPIEEDIPQSLIQGFDPQTPLNRRLLNGLDLFCGGGNFGRGLEESGALHNQWAVDLFSAAVQTYSANLKDPDKTDIFFGSVNDLLAHAFKGNPRKLKIPLPGDVDVILAGSPCQGFSRMNTNKGNDQGLRNQSLIASVAAYIDFYRPKYGLLENVLNMAQKGLGRDEDVLSQLICAIVGLGYQVQLFLLDAWSFGSPQSRSQIFVSFAASGCVPLEHPQLSHSHPPHVGERGLGKLANGQSFGSRVHCATPFKFRTAEDSVTDLPYIGDGATSQCTKYPDHVLPQTLSKLYRLQVACIPTHPRGMNFWKTWNDGNGVMTKAERNLFPFLSKSGKIRESVIQGSHAWGRIKPRGLFPTILVTMNMEDGRMGTILHWDQQRRLTMLELRRAQSFPDNEVIIGKRSEQIKIIGNSFDRSVSMALGISLRNAWLQCSPEHDRSSTLVKTRSSIPMPEILLAIPSSTASTTVEVVLSQRPKVGPYAIEVPNGVSNGTAIALSSSDSAGSSMSGFDDSSSSESVSNLRSTISMIQRKRYLAHPVDEPARKSPRLSPSINLPSKARELFAKSIYNLDALSGFSSTSPPAPRTITIQRVFEAVPDRASPDLFTAPLPASPVVTSYQTSEPHDTNHTNEVPPTTRENPVIIDDSEADSEDTIWVESGPRASTLLHRESQSRTHTPKSSSSHENPSSKHPRPSFIDLTEPEIEGHDQAISNPSPQPQPQPQSSLEVRIPFPSLSTRMESIVLPSSSTVTPSSPILRPNRLAPASGKKYVPVDNSQFNAYAQTNRTMKNADNGSARSTIGMRGLLEKWRLDGSAAGGRGSAGRRESAAEGRG